MRMNIRSFVLFAGLCGMLLACNSQGSEDVMPPEVQKLIGMKILPKVVGRKQADIPNFHPISGALIDEDVKQGSALTYSEGVVDNKWPVFIVEMIASDMSAEILDAKMLPANLIEWQMENGNKKYLDGRYKFSGHCQTKEESSQIIFGLVKPEKGKSDCAHFSRRVKLAWLIDRQSGQITPLPSKDVMCEYITMSECY